MSALAAPFWSPITGSAARLVREDGKVQLLCGVMQVACTPVFMAWVSSTKPIVMNELLGNDFGSVEEGQEAIRTYVAALPGRWSWVIPTDLA